MSKKKINAGGHRDEVLVVRVEDVEEHRDRVRNAVDAVEQGDTPEEPFLLTLPGRERLNDVLSTRNVDLIRAIAREEPGSIRETARIVERDVKDVHGDLQELEALGLVRFEEEGRAKRPVVWYDDIHIEADIPVKA